MISLVGVVSCSQGYLMISTHNLLSKLAIIIIIAIIIIKNDVHFSIACVTRIIIIIVFCIMWISTQQESNFFTGFDGDNPL